MLGSGDRRGLGGRVGVEHLDGEARAELATPDRVRVEGNLELDDGLHTDGTVRLPNATVSGYLRLSGARLSGPFGASERGIALLADGGFVLLDTATTAELEAEGLARDVIRAVQDTRKAAGFDVSDRIRLELAFDDIDDRVGVETAFSVADVAGETLAVEHALYGPRGSLPDTDPDHTAEFPSGTFANRGAFTVSVTKVEAYA